MSGKNLSIIAGILTLLATWFFSWYSVKIYWTTYMYGIAGLLNVLNIIINPDSLTKFALIYSNIFLVYIVAILALLFLMSGPMQLIGAKKRAIGIIGSIMPLIMGIMLLLIILNIIPMLGIYFAFFTYDGAIIPGIIPFDYSLPGRPESIGSYFLIIGGVLGLIAGLMPRSYY